MIKWTMIGQGIDINPTPAAITEDLKTLLKANEIIERYQARQSKQREKLREQGRKSFKYKTSMTIADRGIAALYVAANFQGDPSEKADVLAAHGDSLVFCLSKRMMSNNEEEEDEE